MFYGLITISADNNNAVEYNHVTSEYNYHMVLKDMNASQAYFLMNDELTVFKSDHIFDIVKTNENTNYITNEPVYDIYISFTGDDIKASEARFREKYFPELQAIGNEGQSFRVSTTPLLNFKDNITANRVTYIFISLILLAFSTFLLMALYNIRINHYKFLYGIYMTFGADFRKLFSTAFWELFVVSLVTFIPATGISALIIYLIYSTSGFTISFSVLSVVKILLFSVISVAAAVFFPMRVMAVRAPMGLIVAQDNSNLVSSPYRSKNILGAKFPRDYELLSLWRFRKYNLQLLVTAVIFSAVFICVLFISEINQTDIEYPRPQFTVDLSKTDFSYDDTMREELYAIDGVTEVWVDGLDTTAYDIGSHIVVNRKNIMPLQQFVKFEKKDGYNATNDVYYSGYTRNQVELLEKYQYDGDLYSIFENDKTIIIGDSISNIKKFNFKVGDKIEIAKKTGQIRAVDFNVSGTNLLRSQIDYYTFEYEEYTIGAILKDIPSEKMPVFMTPEEFEWLTGIPHAPKKLNIYIDQSYTSEQVEEMELSLRDWGRTYGLVNIVNHHALNLKNIEQDKNYTQIFICLSVLILLISPLAWFFSQTLYYMKRENEFNIVLAMGGLASEIKKIYIFGGIAMGIMSFIFCVILSYLGSYAMFYFYNVSLPYFTHEFIRYSFYMPWYAILTSVVVSVSCGFLSAYLPYRSYIKKRVNLEMSGEFGVE